MLPSACELTYFLTLAKTLNFSKAAEIIGIAQPTLSLAIKRLETNLGSSLFIRSKHKVVLTAAGEALQHYAKQLTSYWQMTKYEVVHHKNKFMSKINIGCPSSIATYLFTELLPNLIQEYPLLQLQLVPGNSQFICTQVLDFSVHLGIVANPTRHPDLIIKHLYWDETMFWGGTHNDSLTLHELAHHVPLICNPELRQTQWLLKYLLKNNIKYSRLISSDNYELIANLVMAGCGIGIAPKTIMQRRCHDQVRHLAGSIRYKDAICLIYRREYKDLQLLQEISAKLSAQSN